VLGYQGDLTDPNTKLVDMGTRYYMPTTGRFTTRDVVFGDPSAPMSLNRFAYALMSPLRYIDPTGMAGCEYAGDVKCNGNLPGDNTGTKKRIDGGRQENGVTTSWTPPPAAKRPAPAPAPDLPDCTASDCAAVAVVATSDVACASGDGCLAGFRGYASHVSDTFTDCWGGFGFWRSACGSSAMGLGVRTIQDTVGGGECHWNPETGHDICTGISRTWVTAPGGATGIGNTISLDAGTELDVDLMAHEGTHVDKQAELLGWAYLYADGYAAYQSHQITGDWSNRCNWLEREASQYGSPYGACTDLGWA
jgi:RHS repeat-associated protein